MKTKEDRENHYATQPPLSGHTNVPWVPGTCNVIGRQIVWVTVSDNVSAEFESFGRICQ